MNSKKIRDIKKYYDITHKVNIWLLGYFGGNSINISRAYTIALQYAKETNTKIESIHIIENFSTYNSFKYIISNTKQLPIKKSIKLSNIFKLLQK